MEESSPVSQYLREIGEIPLLNSEQEYQLAKRMREGDVEARNRLIEANLRLVVNVAKHYSGGNLSLLDLIQEGNLGLLHAAEKFDLDMGCRFSTYATCWIKQYVVRSMGEQGRCIRIPVYMMELIGKIEREKKRLTQVMLREPTLKEVADSLSMTEERVREVLLFAEEPISLETPIGEEEGYIQDLLPDENHAPIDEIVNRLFNKEIDALISSLPQREQDIVRMRFGFYDGSPKTLEQISKTYHITRERVRQLEVRALWRLRRERRMIGIAGYR